MLVGFIDSSVLLMHHIAAPKTDIGNYSNKKKTKKKLQLIKPCRQSMTGKSFGDSHSNMKEEDCVSREEYYEMIN